MMRGVGINAGSTVEHLGLSAEMPYGVPSIYRSALTAFLPVYRNALTAFLLVSKLIGDLVQFVDLAMRALRNEYVVVAERQRPRRRDPGFDKRLGVVDGHFVQDFIARARELLHDAHVAGVEETAAPQPCRIDERNGVDHQRVALPLAHGVAQIGRLS